MEYRIIATNDRNELTGLVNQEIKNGWIPQGGPFTIFTDYGFRGAVRWHQAMVKKQGAYKNVKF